MPGVPVILDRTPDEGDEFNRLTPAARWIDHPPTAQRRSLLVVSTRLSLQATLAVYGDHSDDGKTKYEMAFDDARQLSSSISNIVHYLGTKATNDEGLAQRYDSMLFQRLSAISPLPPLIWSKLAWHSLDETTDEDEDL